MFKIVGQRITSCTCTLLKTKSTKTISSSNLQTHHIMLMVTKMQDHHIILMTTNEQDLNRSLMHPNKISKESMGCACTNLKIHLTILIAAKHNSMFTSV